MSSAASLQAVLQGFVVRNGEYSTVFMSFTLLEEYAGEFEGGCAVVLSHSVVSDSLQPYGLQPSRLLCPLNSPGKNTGESYHALLQGILPTQGSNPGLLHFRQILYHLSHQGSPTS